jgi:hypothetical protein
MPIAKKDLPRRLDERAVTNVQEFGGVGDLVDLIFADFSVKPGKID